MRGKRRKREGMVKALWEGEAEPDKNADFFRVWPCTTLNVSFLALQSWVSLLLCLYIITRDGQRAIVPKYTFLPRKQEWLGRKLWELKAERHTFKSKDPSKNEKIVWQDSNRDRKDKRNTQRNFHKREYILHWIPSLASNLTVYKEICWNSLINHY